MPGQVWLYCLCWSNLMNDSKSGIMLPIIKPVGENIFQRLFIKGKTIAGWEKVNGIAAKIVY
jgi:hypothetical protein